MNQRFDFILIDRLFTIFAIGLVRPMTELTKPMDRHTLNTGHLDLNDKMIGFQPTHWETDIFREIIILMGNHYFYQNCGNLIFPKKLV